MRNAMMTLMYNTRSRRTSKLIKNIVGDYNEVFGQSFQTLYQVSNYISKNNLTAEKIQKSFAEKGITAYEEIHYCPKGDVINQQLLAAEQIYSSRTNFEARLNLQRKQFVKDILESGFYMNAFIGREGADLQSKYPD